MTFIEISYTRKIPLFMPRGERKNLSIIGGRICVPGK
jgi:hypothetical protein